MYGYVVMNKPELKFREYDECRAYYCGLCDSLRERYGRAGQLTLSYDMTFLVYLLTGLYEPETKCYDARCSVHPVRKHEHRKNAVTEYVADMSILMAYDKCMDDWEDEHRLTRRMEAAALRRKREEICNRYPAKAEKIREALQGLKEAEARQEQNLDKAAGYFGQVMAQLAMMKEDEWKEVLYRLGFCLGKFVYLMDAYEDLPADRKAGRYNVLAFYRDRYDSEEEFDSFCQGTMNAIMAECARQFELLPIVLHAEILRNILYSGVWTKFDLIREKRKRKEEKQ